MGREFFGRYRLLTFAGLLVAAYSLSSLGFEFLWKRSDLEAFCFQDPDVRRDVICSTGPPPLIFAALAGTGGALVVLFLLRRALRTKAAPTPRAYAWATLSLIISVAAMWFAFPQLQESNTWADIHSIKIPLSVVGALILLLTASASRAFQPSSDAGSVS